MLKPQNLGFTPCRLESSVYFLLFRSFCVRNNTRIVFLVLTEIQCHFVSVQSHLCISQAVFVVLCGFLLFQQVRNQIGAVFQQDLLVVCFHHLVVLLAKNCLYIQRNTCKLSQSFFGIENRFLLHYLKYLYEKIRKKSGPSSLKLSERTIKYYYSMVLG